MAQSVNDCPLAMENDLIYNSSSSFRLGNTTGHIKGVFRMSTGTKLTAAGPVEPSRQSIYYGWANLVIAALAMVGTLPGRTQGLGLVTEPLISNLHMDRVTFAAVNLWATLIGAAFCLPYGRLLDRFGSRLVLTTVTLGLGVSVLAMR